MPLRNVFSVASKLYDPHGICSPLFVCVKILLQEAWDTPLPKYLNIAWMKWFTDLEKVGCIVIQRCIYHGISDNIVACNLQFWRCIIKGIFYNNLHSFRNAYHQICQDNCFEGCCLFLPRLELLSGVITAKICNTGKVALGRHVKFNDCYY